MDFYFAFCSERFCLFHVRLVVYFQFMWRHYLMVARRWELFANFVPRRNGVCVYMRESTRKWKRAAGGNVENWPRGCCVELEFACSVIGVFFCPAIWIQIAIWSGGNSLYMRVMRGMQMEFGFATNIKCVSLVRKNQYFCHGKSMFLDARYFFGAALKCW